MCTYLTPYHVRKLLRGQISVSIIAFMDKRCSRCPHPSPSVATAHDALEDSSTMNDEVVILLDNSRDDSSDGEESISRSDRSGRKRNGERAASDDAVPDELPTQPLADDDDGELQIEVNEELSISSDDSDSSIDIDGAVGGIRSACRDQQAQDNDARNNDVNEQLMLELDDDEDLNNSDQSDNIEICSISSGSDHQQFNLQQQCDVSSSTSSSSGIPGPSPKNKLFTSSFQSSPLGSVIDTSSPKSRSNKSSLQSTMLRASSHEAQSTHELEDDEDEGWNSDCESASFPTSNVQPVKRRCVVKISSGAPTGKCKANVTTFEAKKKSATTTGKGKGATKRVATKSVRQSSTATSDLNELSTRTTEVENATTDTTKSKQKRGRKWGGGYYSSNNRKAKATNDDSSASTALPTSLSNNGNAKTTSNNNDNTKHYHTYLLRSLSPDHPLKTYIGFTTHPSRRIRQHNGILKNGGARRTKRSGRPWTFTCVIAGFQDKITALQFEWAWQNVGRSKCFRDAVGDDALAKKMGRRMGVKARLEELRVLVKACLPFCLYSLTVYFPEAEYQEMFLRLVACADENVSGEATAAVKDGGESGATSGMVGGFMSTQVCAVEDMPFAKELEDEKERKREARKKKTAANKASKSKKTINCTTDISDWIESGNEESDSCSMMDESDVSDFSAQLMRRGRAMRSSLGVVAEDLCSSDDESVAASPSSSYGYSKQPASPAKQRATGSSSSDDEVLALDFQSLSIDKKKSDGDAFNKNDCDFSTITSGNSSDDCSLGDDVQHLSGGLDAGTRRQNEKENIEPRVVAMAAVKQKNIDVYDLCFSP